MAWSARGLWSPSALCSARASVALQATWEGGGAALLPAGDGGAAQPLDEPVLRDLGNGLLIRRATADDIEDVAALHGRNHDNDVAGWVRAMMANAYASPEPDYFLLVEDTGAGRIVSSLGVIPGVSCYCGIPLKSARIELVSTDAEHRRQGLVRALFGVAHELFRQQGVLIDFVTGRPWFYRQFGPYALALPEHEGIALSMLGLDASSPHHGGYALREARAEDLASFGALYRDASRRYVLFRHLSDPQLVAEFGFPEWTRVITNGGGTTVGFVTYHPALDESTLVVRVLEVAPGTSWLAVKPAVLRCLCDVGEALAAESGDRLRGIALRLGQSHAFYQVVPEVAKRAEPGFAGYVRIGDLPAFFRVVASVLEERIARSVLVGYTGSVRINLWSRMTGVDLSFERGRLQDAQLCVCDMGDANLPQEFLTQLAVGRRSLDELGVEYPEVRILRPDVDVLLRVLFPKQPSYFAR